MIDNQAAPQSEGGILDINRRVVASMSPSSDGVLGQLRALGVDPASLTRRPDAPMTDAQRNDLLWQNAKSMTGEMFDAALEGRWSDVSPSQVGSALVQAGTTKLLGQTAGAAIGGIYDEIQAIADFPMQSRNWFARMVTGKSLPELADAAFGGTAPLPVRMLASRGASADALLDDKFTARSRTVDPMASRGELAAAIGEYDPMSAPGIAGALSSAATQVGTAIALSSIPGGQVAGAARASTAIGRILAPAKALLGNPGGRVYLGYAGGRQAINRSADYLRFNEMDRNATSQYNAAIDRLGLGDVLDKQEVPEYSRMTDLGVSLASGAMTAFSEMIGTGFSVAAGKRIIGRLYGGFTPKAAEGGMREMLKASAKGFFASGSMEGLEEVVDGYGQAIIGGWYDWTEEGGFAWAEKTGGSFDPLAIFKKHAPELFYDFAIAFAVSAPLGAGGGIASVNRRRNWHDAFTKALMRDQIAVDETGATRGESDFLAAQAIAQAMAGGDPSILPSVLEHLRKTMPEIGQVTESQLRDPAWVAQFVRNFPLVAVRLSEMDGLSRTQSEWLTGTAARGRVPGADARGQFLELVRAELRNMIPTYMQGWYERSTAELEAYNRQLQELGDKTDDRSRLLRAQAKSRIKFILDIRKQVQLAWVNKETIDQSTFESWLRFDEAAESVDIDGTADARETSPSTARSDAPGTDEIRARARAGDAEAAFTLAQMHESGQGAEQHFYKSQYWMSVALANSGDVEAMVYLGRMYAGRAGAYPPMAGAPRSINKARAWLRKAYELGSDEAGQLLAELETGSPARPRPGRIDAAEAAQAARRQQTPPAASAAQPAPATPQEAPAAPAASPAVSEAPSVAPVAQQPESASVEADPAADTRRAVDARVAVEQRMQAEEQARAEAERAEAERRAADEADAPRREVERQVQQGAGDPGLRVRFVEAATPVEEKIAKAAGKLGKRVQYIRIFRDEAREGDRRRRTPSGIRGFVGSDANTIYLVQVPNVMREQATTAYYLQTLAHENAHGVIRESDAETLKRVDALSSRALIAEFERRFDLGKGEERREEIRVQTLTLGVVDAAGLDAILLADTAVEKTIARLKLLFGNLKIVLTGNERAALLKRLTQEQVARAKAPKEAEPAPAPAAAEPAATRAAKPKPAPKPAPQPTDDLAELMRGGQYVVGTTIQSGIPIEVVADGKTVVVDSTSQSKGVELRIMRKKLYLLSGSTASVVTSARILDKPSVGKAKPKAAQPQAAQPQAAAEPAPQVDPANEPVASELPKPRRGRGKKGDGQQAMFMREKRWGMPTMGSAFSGMGTWEIAMRGIADPVSAIEMSPNIAVAYALNNGEHVMVEDVTKVRSDIAKGVDLFCASPVCKAYSDANRNRGEQDLDIASAQWVASVVRDSRPANIAIENVPSYKTNEAYRIIEASLREHGYKFDANVYDSSDFGAATSRKRLIVRATLGELPPLPSPSHGVGGVAKVGWMEAAGDLIGSLPAAPPIKKGSLVDRWLEMEGGLGSEPLLIMGSPPGLGTKRKGIRTTRRGDEPSPTIKATPKEVIRVWTGSEMKRATPRFLARLHGITDDVSLPSDEKLAKTVIGNGIPLPLVRAVVGPMVAKRDGVSFMREISGSTLSAEAKSSIKRGHLMFMRAWHGGPKGIEQFDPDRIRRIAFGWGVYASGDKATSIGYALQDGVAYELDYDGTAMIDLDAEVYDQPQAVRDAIVQIADELGLRAEILSEYAIDDNYRSASGDILQHRALDAIKAFQLQVMINTRFGDSRPIKERELHAARAVSMMLLQRGVTGGRYADYRSASTGNSSPTDVVNYVFYDPAAIRIASREDMPDNLNAWRKAFDSAADSADRGVSFMRERTDTQLAADHRAAFERGDEAAAREIVREYGRRKGYTIGAYHGTFDKFDEFNLSAARGTDLGFHFGDRSAASKRIADIRQQEPYYASRSRPGSLDGFDRVIEAFLRISNPLELQETRRNAWQMGDILGQLFDEQSPVAEFEPDTDAYFEDNLESTVGGEVVPYSELDDNRETQNEWLGNYLGSKGFDGIVYENRIEGGTSYIVFDSKSIKSADPFTYDSNGELIPLDKRFDDTTSDIRFLREKPGSAFEMFRDDSPASSRTNGLATALLWKYTILDRAVKAARRKMKIEPDDAANELFQLAPGISSRIMLDFGNAEVRPYEEAVKNLAKRLGMNKDKVMDLVQEHAFLKHALDVIAWLEKRDAVEIQRRADRAFTDLDAMGIEVSPDEIYEQVKDRMTALGLSKEQAQARLRDLDKQFAADKAWSNLSDRLRAMNRKTLEIHRQAGNITEAAYQELVQRYPNYVPVVTSLFGDEVDQPTDSVKRPARRILRRMFRGRKVDQVANVDALRKFWAASWDLTKYDRMKAAHAASLVPADNAMFRLARQGALLMQGGDPLVEVVDMKALVEEQAMQDRMRLRRERDAAEAKALEDGVELPPFKIDDAALMREAALKVANDIDMQIAGSANDAPSIRRFKLERDTDLTPQEVYEDIHHFMETGLTVKQAIANEEAAANGEKPKHTPLKPGTAAFDKRKDQLESRIRLMPKGTVMHYRINDPELAQAMLLNEPTMLEKMRSEGGLVARNFAKAWMKLMAFQRFAFVSASPGFWKGELFRSPQQAAIMARVMADELRLSPEQKDAFLRNLDAIVGRFYPLIGVVGAARAMPGGKPWRSVRHVLKGNEPRNAYEKMVRQAIDDGVLQGGVYSVDSYETMVSRLKERIGKSMEGPPTLRQRGADKVGDVMSAISDSVDQITNGLDMVNRLNVYQAATMAGISRQQAAIMARESTVDFSKKGASIRGASQIYLFLSPRMQGIHQLLRAFSTGEGKTMAARTAASASKRILMRMFLWAFAWKMLREFFYEDDDEPQSVPSQFASLQNMLVPMFAWNDKKQHMYLEINNPYGFGAIAKLADRLGEFMVGDSTAIQMLVGAVGDFGSELTPLAFDLKNPSSLIQAITPTNLQVGTDLMLNQDWKGSPIYPEGAKFGPGEQRRSQQYYVANTWRTTIWLADMISDLTRPIYQTFGFEGQRGLEISPNQIQYVMQRWMPGLVRQAADGVSWASGQDVTVDRLPLIGSFVTQTGGRSVVGGQWRDMGTIRANMKVDLKEGRESRRQILERYGDVGRWFERGVYDNAERQIKKLQEARNKAMRAGKREIFDRINDRIEAIQTRVLREYARIRERSTGGGLDTMFQRGVLN